MRGTRLAPIVHADDEIALLLRCSVEAVKLRRCHFGLPPSQPNMHYWAEAEKQLLGTAPDEAIVAQFGRSVQSVHGTPRGTEHPQIRLALRREIQAPISGRAVVDTRPGDPTRS